MGRNRRWPFSVITRKQNTEANNRLVHIFIHFLGGGVALLLFFCENGSRGNPRAFEKGHGNGVRTERKGQDSAGKNEKSVR